MLIPVEWLEDYVTLVEPAEALADRLTLAGLEVEDVRHTEAGPAFHVKVTPNRGDCLSIVGVAREVAALTRQTLSLPGSPPPPSGAPEPGLRVDVEAPDLCPRYVAMLIRDVRDAASPAWMQQRLTAAGLRPINAVVDATNYVMLELGQPLHAFDYDLLHERRIVVRLARKGEALRTIDGTNVRMSEQMLVIADADRPVALAGVMGGAETEVSPGTRNILLESAQFLPASIRRTARATGLATAASYRFERTVDPGGVRAAAERAAGLIAELAGGTVSGTVVDSAPGAGDRQPIRFRPGWARERLGAAIDDAEMGDSLARLGLECATGKGDCWEVTPPSWRADLNLPEDLEEEVGRLHGYDRLPGTLPTGSFPPAGTSHGQRVTDAVREVMLGCGCFEAATSSLTSMDALAAAGAESPIWFAGGSRPVALRNPLSAEWSVLRTSLLPGLLSVLDWNLRHGTTDAWLFETGWVHAQPEAGGPHRSRLLGAAVLYGSAWAEVWNADPAWRADYYTARGLFDAVASRLGMPSTIARPEELPGLHPGRSARLYLPDPHGGGAGGLAVPEGNGAMGVLGELDPEVAADLDLPRGVCVLEFDLQALIELASPGGRYEPPSRYPAVQRDLALVVDRATGYAEIAAAIRDHFADWLRQLRLFDVYQGPPLPGDHRSLGIALRLGARNRTLTEEEVDARLASLLALLRERFGAELRTG